MKTFMSAKPSIFVSNAFAGAPPGKVLDLGCGTGRNSIPLLSKGFDVYFVDFSRPMLELAMKKAREAGCILKKSRVALRSISSLKGYKSNFFDFVIASGTLHQVAGQGELEALVGSIRRILKIGGKVVVEVFTADHIGANLHPTLEGVYMTDSGIIQTLLPANEIVNIFCKNSLQLLGRYSLCLTKERMGYRSSIMRAEFTKIKSKQ